MKAIQLSVRVLFPLLLLFAVCVSVFLRLHMYFTYNYDFLIGFDTGKYIYDLNTQISTSIKSLDLWVEPSLNTNLTFIKLLSGVDAFYVYKYFLPIFVSFYFILIVFLYTRLLTNNKIAAIFACLYLATSTVFINSTFDSFYRQIFGSLILMCVLYFIEKIHRTDSLKGSLIVMFSLLGAGIIVSHRGITLLFMIIMAIWGCIYIYRKQYTRLKNLALIVLGSASFSSVYWTQILYYNLLILRDTVKFSIEGKTGGATTIKTLNRTDNQIIGYFKSISNSFITIVGVVYLARHRKWYIFTILTLFLIVYIFLRATFSNRFLFNLDLILAITVGVAYTYLFKHFNARAVNFIFLSIFLLNFIYAYDLTSRRVPYVPYKTDSVKWVEQNIDKKNSLIIAPDALATILTSMGYSTSIYEFPMGHNDSRIVDTETFLAQGFDNPSFLNDKIPKVDNIYITFGEWQLSHPMGRTDFTIPISSWDESSNAEKMYEGDSYLIRVYRIKNYQAQL